MSILSSNKQQERPLWLPPVAGVLTLFALFLAAMLTRRADLGEAGRTTMIGLSAIGASGVSLYGGKMVIDMRRRGIWSAVSGIVMLFMGIYTLLHVLR